MFETWIIVILSLIWLFAGTGAFVVSSLLVIAFAIWLIKKNLKEGKPIYREKPKRKIDKKEAERIRQQRRLLIMWLVLRR